MTETQHPESQSPLFEIPHPPELPGVEDLQSDAELKKLQIDGLKAQVEYYRTQVDSMKADIGQREKYGKHVFGLTIVWLLIVLTIVVLQALAVFGLSESVMITLIGSTTLNIIGLLVIVLKYIFRT